MLFIIASNAKQSRDDFLDCFTLFVMTQSDKKFPKILRILRVINSPFSRKKILFLPSNFHGHKMLFMDFAK